MTEAEVRAILKTYGWIYKERTVYKTSPVYVYAKRRQGVRVVDLYICPLSKIGELTEAELVAKLMQHPPTGGQPPPAAEKP
jgi:hypothetical protein